MTPGACYKVVMLWLYETCEGEPDRGKRDSDNDCIAFLDTTIVTGWGVGGWDPGAHPAGPVYPPTHLGLPSFSSLFLERALAVWANLVSFLFFATRPSAGFLTCTSTCISCLSYFPLHCFLTLYF